MDILKEIISIAIYLNKPYNATAHSDIKGLSATNVIFPDDALGQFKVIINTLIGQLNRIIDALNALIINTQNGDFSKKNYVNALFNGGIPLVNAVTSFISINGTSLNTPVGSMWDVITRVIQHNVENYDNTHQNPKPQLQGSELEAHLDLLDVTPYDKYSKAKTTSNFDKFIGKVEQVEAIYQKNPSAINLREILFVLLAHQPLVVDYARKSAGFSRFLNDVEYLVTGDTDTMLRNIRVLFEQINIAIISRHQGVLEDPSDTHPSPDLGPRGGLHYLLMESHSTSRRELRSEVAAFLKKAIKK